VYNGFAQDYSIEFDGINDYISMGDINDFNIEPGENFTFCAWFKLNALPNYQRILCKRDGGNPGYEIWLNDEGKLAVNIRTTGMDDVSYWSNSYGTVGDWHFVAFVINTTDKTSLIYFNGFLSATNTGEALSQGITSDAPFVLGARSIQDYYLNGVLDEVSLWKTALSQAEIQDVMNGSLTGNESGLTGYWRFDDQATKATDYSFNNHNGNIYGAQYVLNNNQYYTDMVYQSSSCNQDEILQPAGRANTNEALLALQIQTAGSLNSFNVNSITINLDGMTSLSDIDSVRIIYTGINPKINSVYQQSYQAVVPSNNDITFEITQSLFHGNNYFWLVCDISSEAAEGHWLDAKCVEFVIDGNQADTYVPENSSPTGEKSIILAHKALFVSGTEGIHTFRIPAIVTTNEGTLIAATDARVDNGADLGWTGNIDIVYKRSTDNGVTWSEMITAADFPGVEGASDCSMIYDEVSDEIFMFYNYADETDEFQWPFMIKSSDDGLSWSEFTNLYNDIYHPSWTWAFVTSGRGIQKSDGGLRHVINVMEGNTPGALIFGSEDHGETWYSVKNPISALANESKLAQLDDGSLMINCRQENTSKRMIGQTTDDGNTWYNIHYDNTLIEPRCNASFIRFTSVLNGYATSRLLFSNPASTAGRENMAVRLSYDEGENWTEARVINPGSSAYSSLTILDDHTIGLFYEANDYKEIRFARFSLNWLTDGTDSIQAPVIINGVKKKANIKIYPNPARDLLNIRFSFGQSQDVILEISDLNGKLLIRKEINEIKEKTSTIPTEILEAGTYMVSIKTDKQTYSRKIVIID